MSIELYRLVIPFLVLCAKSVHNLGVLDKEYFDESEVPNIFDEFKAVVSDPIKSRSWEREDRCRFPNANVTIRLESIRQGHWIPLALLQHSDNHLHPFVSPYGPLRCLRVMTRYDPTLKWLSLSYGCRENASSPWRWDYRFEFLPNKRIIYRDRYGCTGARQLRRTVIADTDYENFLLLHGCQSNGERYLRANGLMVLVRTLAISDAVRSAIENYTHRVLQTPSQLTYLNSESADAAPCNCSVANGFAFCDPKYRFRRDRELVPLVNRTYYRCLAVVAVLALLMATFVLVEQLYTFQSTLEEVNYTLID
ncbi:complement component C8 gamma chain-like protein [Anopheles sinensis]|uniref:Complement component C8 gamma chain-like protein n=1 Tax=Anopheles sinensis TaxID=74873 RepID=A0A084VS94_ANOSI|nr:complement component C8 gamma chain-like protein [Anopheles sinensis]